MIMQKKEIKIKREMEKAEGQRELYKERLS